MSRKHGSEILSCSNCEQRFRSAIAEARHRHNYPLLCGSTKAARKVLARKRRADKALYDETLATP